MAVELAFTREGQGPNVVLLHGLLGRGRNWLSIAKALADSFTLILVDLRNHGASPWAEPVTYEAMAEDVAALIERQGAPVRLLGHSLGGKVAMTLALTRPELVLRLIVVDIAPVAYDHADFEDLLAAMQALDLGSMTRRGEADAALTPAVPDPALRGFLLQNLGTGATLSWKPNLAALRAAMPAIRGFPEGLAQCSYAGPTLFLRGERSRYVLPEHAPAIARMFPAHETATVPGAGHWPHSERPQAFLEALRPRLVS